MSKEVTIKMNLEMNGNALIRIMRLLKKYEPEIYKQLLIDLEPHFMEKIFSSEKTERSEVNQC